VSEIEPRTPQAENESALGRRQCSRIMKTGERCKKSPILGGTICSKHGGRAPHIKAAAKARLENAADRLARQLLGMIDDPKMAPAIKLAALKDALDRAGLSARQAVDITATLKPYEELLDELHRGGSDYDDAPPKLRPGMDPNDPRLGGPDDDYDQPDTVDGEVVDDPYADNPLNPDTGRVHCQGCDAALPGLDRLREPGLTKYPTRCGGCREVARAERGTERELDATVGAGSVVPPRSVPRVVRPAPAPTGLPPWSGTTTHRQQPPTPASEYGRTSANPRYPEPSRREG
jgi:hypothetical protein